MQRNQACCQEYDHSAPQRLALFLMSCESYRLVLQYTDAGWLYADYVTEMDSMVGGIDVAVVPSMRAPRGFGK